MAWQNVNVKVVLNSDNPVDFDLIPDPPLPAGDGKNEFIFRNDGHDGFLLNFILDGELGADYYFPNSKADAMYSAKGTGCPTKPDQWPQFKVKEVKPGNKILVVRNLNQKNHEGCFGFTLRVTKNPHVSDPVMLELDPGGTNTNGPTSKITSAYLSMGALAVTSGILSALATVAALRITGLLVPAT